jgi:hypothetical protein
MSLDLNTLRVDSSLTISTPDKFLQALVSHNGELYGLWIRQDLGQFGVINPHTGQVIRWLTEGPLTNINQFSYPPNFSSDGNVIFHCTSSGFDNRISALDPSTFTTVQENHNPVFETAGLAWDGVNFWILDYETQTFAKLKLEGM